MKKATLSFGFILCSFFILSSFGAIGEKTASMSVIYGAVAFFSLALLAAYHLLVYKKELWFACLFTAVFIVNTGYFLLSVSKTLEQALFANRISYLGSVFLPMIMLVIIMRECKSEYNKWFIAGLSAVSILVFLLAASPGYLDIYYKSVTLTTVNGVSVLEKVYGPLHCVYLFYLLIYFGSMVAIIIFSAAEKKIGKTTHAVILAGSVFINICVWFFEQLVKMDFELLSVSYICSELFLLGIHLLLQEKEEERKEKEAAFIKSSLQEMEEKLRAQTSMAMPKPVAEDTSYMEECLASLTPTEKKIMELHLLGKSTKEIMTELCITENTVKFHNKNLYRKLDVTSKKQLIERYSK